MAEELVVVGLDGSPASQTALQWAVHVAACSGGSVDAVHAWRWDVVLDAVPPDAPTEVAQAAQSAAESQLEKALADRPDPAPPVPVQGRAVEGDPARALLDAQAQATLLVLGRHGQGSWERRLLGPRLGSVAGQCLSHASVPVAIVPPDTPAAAPSRVLVGIDGSVPSARALRWAVQHGRAVGAPVVAVLAWQLTSIPAPEPREDWSVPPLPEWEASARRVLGETVEAALGADEAAGVERLVLHRPPAGGLLETTRAEDLLVLGERGRGGFARLLLGSVSRQCAEHAPCPVVVVPGRDRHQRAA